MGENKIFYLSVGGGISFNVDYIPQEQYEWFCCVVGNMFIQTYKAGKEASLREIKESPIEISQKIGVDMNTR